MSSPFCSSPGERDLPGRALRLVGDIADDSGRAHVGVEIIAFIARVVAAEIAFRIILGALDPAGQEAAAQRAERHQPDAEFA